MSTKEEALHDAPGPVSSMRAPWMLLSILTVFLWGGWGLESKFVVDRISPYLNQVIFSAGLLPPLIWILFSRNLRRATGKRRKGAFYGLLTGVLGGTGNIAFYLGLAKGGKAAVVVPLVGLAPLVTVVLAFFLLRESLNRIQIVGLLLALVSIFLLSL
ncbi:MAG TPA: DMT family transporter [Bryobacteraceae bacterium]|jgi:transporter family protein